MDAVIIVGRIPGKIWLKRIRKGKIPKNRAYRTYSRSFRLKTSPRMILAVSIQLNKPMTITRENRPLPKTIPKTITNIIQGMEERTSTRRMKKKSTTPPKYPERSPIITPRPILIAIDKKPTISETLPP